MLSLENIAAVKVAVEICNDSELKRKILFASDDVNKQNNIYDSKQQWDEIVEETALDILKKRGLPRKLQKKVLGFVPGIGIRILTWAEYHEGTLGFSREYSIDFLNSSFFTQRGIIDTKKTAEELLNDKNLSIEQKYKLACLYCFEDHIPALYMQLTKEDNEKFCSTRPQRIKQPELVRFWSYYQMGGVDRIKGEKTVDQYRLEKAVESGSKAAVEYCFEKTNLSLKKYAIVDAAVEAVRNRIIARSNWIVFQDWRYDDGTWVPSDYYVDIVSFLLSQMREGQQIEFLKKDIEGVKYKRESLEDHRRSRVLEYFLNWPYQDYFMKMVGMMWEFLPERNYALLLLKICDKIESEKGNLRYAEERIYDYRGLLKEFWSQSPERYKRYVLSNQQIAYEADREILVEASVCLLSKLLTLKEFTREDGKNIGMILASAKDEEKENILSSKKWRKVCIELIKEEKWEMLDRFVLNRFSSKQANDFKKELIFTKEAQGICIDFVKNDKWDAAESAISWSSLSAEEVYKLKKEMIYSGEGKRACWDLFLNKEDVEVKNKFCKWYFASEEEVKEFKKDFIFSGIGVVCCGSLVLEDKLELADKFISWCLFSQDKIKEFKKSFSRIAGYYIFEKLISDYRTFKFKGGKWEEVEKFLTWCFSSEEEIIDFKKNVLLEMSGVRIHFNLIKSNQWEEAETFFAWLGLSAEEIKNLKKETLFRHGEARGMFSDLMYSKESDEKLVDCWNKQEAFELLLRWYLTDKETVLEFKDEFRFRVRDMDDLKVFDLMIEQRLKDLDNEQMGVKRKSETFSFNKKLCNLKTAE